MSATLLAVAPVDQPRVIAFRKVADTAQGERIVRFDPETGEKRLVNPATGQPEGYPLLGVQIVNGPEGDGPDREPGAPPERTVLPSTTVDQAVIEGWMTRENERPVVKPSGPADRPWNGVQPPHVFLHADAIVIHTLGGDVRYEVVRQPDKYDADGYPHDRAGDPDAEVFLGYELRLVEG